VRSPLRAAPPLVVAFALLSSCATTPVRSGTVRAQDGVEIAYDVRGPRSAGEELPTLLFVHCWSGHRGFWRDQLDLFAAEHRVVALDLAGHGASGHDRTDWSLFGLAGDVQAVADALRLERMILIGHSMGGPVSLEAARRMRGRVQGVVLVDTLQDVEFEFPPGFVQVLAQRFEADFAGTMKEFVGALFTPAADPADVEWTLEQATLVPDHRAAVALLRGFETLDLRAVLAGAGVPVRAINAEGGMPTSLEHNRKVADFDAVLLESVGHFPHIERPREFNAELERVLASIEADGRR